MTTKVKVQWALFYAALLSIAVDVGIVIGHLLARGVTP